MKRIAVLLPLLALAAPPAAAQAPAPDSQIETVTVTGERIPEAIIHQFVQSYAVTASPAFGAITRWNKPICLGTEGLSSESLNAFVTKRVGEIAAQVGVKVEEAPCRINVEILFTSDPQAFLDQVYVEAPALLGVKRTQAKAASQISHPIQAWYATGMEDIRGNVILDNNENVGYTGNSVGRIGGVSQIPTMNVEGSLLRTGMRSDMAHVYIVADTNKTANFKLGPVADYIAMMALSQTKAFEACRPLPSVTNLMAADCADSLKADSATPTDLAYLKGVYRMNPGANFQTQQTDIATEMERAGVAQ